MQAGGLLEPSGVTEGVRAKRSFRLLHIREIRS